jgi:hypothetical protein
MCTKGNSRNTNKQILNSVSLLIKVSRRLLYVQVNQLWKACYLKYLNITCIAIQPNLWVFVHHNLELFVKISSNLVPLLKKMKQKGTTFWICLGKNWFLNCVVKEEKLLARTTFWKHGFNKKMGLCNKNTMF